MWKLVTGVLKGASLVTNHASDIHEQRTDRHIEVLKRGWEVEEIILNNHRVM